MQLPLLDLVHRAALFGLVTLGAGGIYLGLQVHNDVLDRGKGHQLANEMKTLRESQTRQGKEIEDEKALARAAQNILKSRKAETSSS